MRCISCLIFTNINLNIFCFWVGWKIYKESDVDMHGVRPDVSFQGLICRWILAVFLRKKILRFIYVCLKITNVCILFLSILFILYILTHACYDLTCLIFLLQPHLDDINDASWWTGGGGDWWPCDILWICNSSYSFVIFKIFISLYGSCFIFIHFICFHLDILCEYWSVL